MEISEKLKKNNNNCDYYEQLGPGDILSTHHQFHCCGSKIEAFKAKPFCFLESHWLLAFCQVLRTLSLLGCFWL